LIVSAATILPPSLVELGREGLDEALAVGLLVVDGRDLLDARARRGTGPRTGPGPRRWCRCGSRWRRGAWGRRVVALGQGRVGVGGGDLDDLRGREDRLDLEGDAGVQGADDTDNVVVTGQLGGGVLAHVRLGLVVDGLDLERPAGDGLLLVGLLDGQLDGVLDAETKAERSPDSGAMTPILATLSLLEPDPESELPASRLPQPARARDATTSVLPIITTER
jgi:hypothetical protein